VRDTVARPATSAPAPVGPDALTPEEVAFVEQVATIAPAWAENPERLARRGANSCASIARGLDVAIPVVVALDATLPVAYGLGALARVWTLRWCGHTVSPFKVRS